MPYFFHESDFVDLVDIASKLTYCYCDRQTTPFDHHCYQVDLDGIQLGSRVFGDCDALMRRVMRGVMSIDELREWEEASDDRLVEYALHRLPTS